VIGQEAEIGPNSFTLEGHASLVICIFFPSKNAWSDMAELVKWDALKMEGQYQILIQGKIKTLAYQILWIMWKCEWLYARLC
jgi:hypothetical protein